jgi:hypothetical protein
MKSEPEKTDRKPYERPKLVRYGTIEEMTRGGECFLESADEVSKVACQ